MSIDDLPELEGKNEYVKMQAIKERERIFTELKSIGGNTELIKKFFLSRTKASWWANSAYKRNIMEIVRINKKNIFQIR